MKALKLISRLIDYPTAALIEHRQELQHFVLQDSGLGEHEQSQVLAFINHRFDMDLIDWQSEYDGLFERGRSLSLLLYEHIHGESRDRGQAMIDLLDQYKAAGLDIGVKELPDYIPLFLEFAATQGDDNARGWLQDVAPIFALLAARLQKRNSNYGQLFEVLLSLSEANIDLAEIRKQIADEQRDDTNKALDKVWEEEAVSFAAGSATAGCSTNPYRPSEGQRRDQDLPISFVDAAAPTAEARSQSA